MTALHPTFAARDRALRDECRQAGYTVWHVGVCRSLATAIRLYNQKPGYAANPYGVGSVTPWGWRYRGSLHMEQVDGWCHAIDYAIFGCSWATFHNLAARHGIGFPLADRPLRPERWHAQWFHGSTFYEPDYGELPPDEPTPAPTRGGEEGDMHEFHPTIRPNDWNVLDFTWLPGEGEAFGVRVLSKLYVRRQHGGAPPDHVVIWMGGERAGQEHGADSQGRYWLPEDGQPIELSVRAGFCSVEGVGAQPVATAQTASWYVG